MGAFLDKHQSTVIVLCLATLTLAVFFQVTGHEFLNYDDNLYVAANPHVNSGLNSANVAWAFGAFRAGNWHPLTWISLMLDASVFGKEAWGFHLMNLLLHIANVLLLFVLLSRMTGLAWRSAFIAALFAIHPLHVESVAWIAERKDVLSTLFWLLTMLAYVGYTRRPSLPRYAGVVVLFALGLMAKPMLVTLPFVLLLMDYWPLGRISAFRRGGLRRPPATGDHGRVAPSETGRPLKASPAALIREKVPLLILAAGSCIVTYTAQQAGGAMAGFHGVPFGLRVENALVSYMIYIAKTLVPIRLAVFYPYSGSIPSWEIIASIMLLAGISYAVYRLRNGRPYLAVGWLWFLVTLVPVIGLIQVGQQSMADRYTYVPLIGLFMMVVYGSMGVWEYGRGRPDTPKPPYSHTPILSLVAIAVLSILSWRQVGFWRDDHTLFTHALAVTTRNHLAHANLGVAQYDAGNLDQALDHFRQAVEIKPNEAVAQCSLGTVLMKLNHTDDAVEHLEAAVRLNNDLEEAHNNLGVLYSGQGQHEQAVTHYREALRIDPDSADAHFNLAAALAASDNPQDAIREYCEAIRLNPDDPAAHNNLGGIYARLGRRQDAVVEFKVALRLRSPECERHSESRKGSRRQGPFRCGVGEQARR